MKKLENGIYSFIDENEFKCQLKYNDFKIDDTFDKIIIDDLIYNLRMNTQGGLIYLREDKLSSLVILNNIPTFTRR